MADDLAASDPVCGTVFHLRQPEVLEERIRRAWGEAGVKSIRISESRILQTHYKPYDRARVLVSAVVEEDKEFSVPTCQYFFLQVYPTVDQAARRFEKGSQKPARRCYGPPLILLDDCASVIWALPNGPKLGPVGIFFDPAKFSRFLSRFALTPSERSSGIPLPRLVRYVPRKRALFCLEVPHSEAGSLYFKIYAPGQDEKPANHLTRLTQAGDGGMLNFRVPRILAYSPAKRTIVMEGLPGVCFTERMKAAEDPAVFALVGGALAGFHRSGIRASDLWAPEKELSRLHTAMSEVRVALPPSASRLDEVLGRISLQKQSLTFNERSVIHGNLFGDQILIDSDRVGIVDWDDFCEGDPLYDLGRLIAHFIFLTEREHVEQAMAARCLKRLIDGYAQTAEKPVAWDRLFWHTAVALLMRAKISALRTLHPGWGEDVSTAIREAGLVLEGRSRWIPN